MPRNKKNKNRAGPPQQQQPAAKTTTPVAAAAAADVIVDVPIAKTDVVVPAVAVPAVEAKPVVVAAVAAAAEIQPPVHAEKTSDNDDDTAGMSKSQKKKKNKNKNKADKTEDTALLAAVAETANKVQANENITVVKSDPQIVKPVEVQLGAVHIDNESTALKTDVPVQQGKKNKKNKNKGKQNEDNKTEDLKVDEPKKTKETPENIGTKSVDKPTTDSNKIDMEKSDVSNTSKVENTEKTSKTESKKSDESNKQQVKKCDDKPTGDDKKTEIQLKEDVKKMVGKPKADDEKIDKKSITDDKKATEVTKSGDITNAKQNKCDNNIVDVKKSEVISNTEDTKNDIKLKDDKLTTDNKAKITQDKENEKKTGTTEKIINDNVIESVTSNPKESPKSENKLENVKGDTNLKTDAKKSDDVKNQNDKINKNKVDAKKPGAQEIKPKDKKMFIAKPETILECPLEQKVQEIIKETKVDKQVENAVKVPKQEVINNKPIVKLPLESSITQPKEIKPACSILNQNIQSPDIASIWKILDPPKEESLHQKPIVDVKPIAAVQPTSEVKSTPPLTSPISIIKDTKKPELIVEAKSIAATLVEALKSETPTRVEIIKSVNDSPEYQTPQPVSSDVIKKSENDTISKTSPKEKCAQEKKSTTPIETAISTNKLLEKSAAIVELPKIESKLVNPIVPLVTAAIIGTTTIVAEQCPKLAPIVTQINTKEAPSENVEIVAESKPEANDEVENKTKTVVTALTNEKIAEQLTTAAKPAETKPDDTLSKTPAVKPEKTTKAKTAATKEKTVKETKTKTSEKPKDSPDKAPTKEPKTKATKTKAKAPAPPSKNTGTALQDVPLTATLPAEESPLLPATSGVQSQPPIPAPTAPTESKNAAGSDSVQSVDVTAVLGSTAAESLQPVKPQEVNVTADVILSNDVNATFTISAKSAKSKTSTAPAETKKPTEAKSLSTTAGADAASSAVQLNDILQSNKPSGKESPAVKPGAVVGNVRTKAAPKVPAVKSTGTVPKTTEPVPKPKQGSPPKENAPKTPTPKGKQASPPKDIAPTAAAPAATKSNARNAKTPPRNASNNTAAAANKSRSSPQKEKSPAHTTASTAKPIVQPRPSNTKPNAAGSQRSASSASSNASNSNSPSPNPPYDDEEYVEFKFSPRPVYMSTICQVCKIPLPSHVHCKLCQMVSYCSVEHLHEDAAAHQPLCAAIQEIAKKRGGHVYNNARILNDDDYRSLRVHTLNLCENALQRHLQPFEREILLFPRLCATGTCREWRQQLLTECKSCGQVSYCAEHANHLAAGHARWCQAFALYQKLVFTQKKYGRIEPSLPSKIMTKTYLLPATMDETFKSLYKNYGAIKEDCTYAALTQLATAPLTAYYGLQRAELTAPIGERFTIHLVGAELQFEADTLDKWETFFLHLVPQLVELRVTFVGPELNAENLPLEILSRIRMCRTCRQNCRAVKFDFQCGQLYHNYATSSAFVKPDLICFFNPGLYRATGFNGTDTWPETIRSAAAQGVPIIVTSYTEVESPRDLERLQREAVKSELALVLAPHVNPFASQRPERNFISDEVAPMIFKNYYCFVCK